jgi:hypothetical protein
MVATKSAMFCNYKTDVTRDGGGHD